MMADPLNDLMSIADEPESVTMTQDHFNSILTDFASGEGGPMHLMGTPNNVEDLISLMTRSIESQMLRHETRFEGQTETTTGLAEQILNAVPSEELQTPPPVTAPAAPAAPPTIAPEHERVFTGMETDDIWEHMVRRRRQYEQDHKDLLFDFKKPSSS